MRSTIDRNRVVLLPFAPKPTDAFGRRPLVVSLVGLLLGLMPAMALAEPKVDAPPLRPANRTGSLVIVGGGSLPDAVRDRFLDLAGGKKGRLVVIPTASELADRTRNYKSYAYWRAQSLASVSMLHTLDPKKANDPAFVKPLTEATAVWLSGGDQSRLSGAYHGTAVELELRRLLARGGVVGGTSAGASVMSSIMITGGNPLAQIGTGFGLLPDVVIDQHFENRRRQKRLQSVLSRYPGFLGLGIDEQTAVVVRGHTFTVMGNANVVVCMPAFGQTPSSLTVLKPGEAGDLLLLSRRLRPREKPSPERKIATSKDRRTAP